MTPEQKERSEAARAARINAQAERIREQTQNIQIAREALAHLTKTDGTTAEQLLDGMRVLAQIIEAR